MNLHDFLADLMRAQSDQYRREQKQVDALRNLQQFTESLAKPIQLEQRKWNSAAGIVGGGIVLRR